MSTIAKQIDTDTLQAARAKDMAHVGVLRMIKTAIKNKEIDKQGELTDDEVIAILKREVKQRQEAMEQYTEGGRDDLARKEEEEMAIIKNYLPAQLSEEEVAARIDDVLKDLDDTDNFGKVMGQVMSAIGGQADGGMVKKILEEKLNK